ncbi:MliC family protein [Leptolyngbya sp. AN02str]|uniref:MliC family protein n=1 Tax=Leptolyngbya sp. AN02str TaxID=3423363 RepID=UPI003D31ED2D
MNTSILRVGFALAIGVAIAPLQPAQAQIQEDPALDPSIDPAPSQVDRIPLREGVPGQAVDPNISSDNVVTTAYYICENGDTFRAEYFPNYARLSLEPGGEVYTLNQEPSGSGIRYSDNSITLYSQEEEAFIEIDGDVAYDDCVSRFVGQSEIPQVGSSSLSTFPGQGVPSRPRFNRPDLSSQNRVQQFPAQTPTTSQFPEQQQAPAARPAAPADEPVRGLW